MAATSVDMPPAAGGGALPQSMQNFSLGPASSVLMAVLVSGYLLGLLLPVGLLSLVPGYTLNWFFWNWFTAGFVERSILSLVLDLVVIGFCGSELEPLWGGRELVRFVVVVNALAGITTYVVMFLVFAVTANEAIWFTTAFGGFVGVSAAFTVALKQQTPETDLNFFGVLPLKVKHLPLVVVSLNLLFIMIGAPLESIPYSLLGVWYGWAYLRWLQRRPDGSVGDPSDSFSMASMFPEAARPLVHGFSAILWSCTKPLHRLGPCTEAPAVESPPEGEGHRLGGLDDSVPEPVDPDVERRRARAMAALEERMMKDQLAAQED